MIMNFGVGGNKAQALYVLWVLENYSDASHFLKQDDIVDILIKHGHFTERKSVGRDLTLLAELGFNIHGVLPELDEDGNELPVKRGKIWLEREISDEKLKLLIDSVLFSNYIGKAEAREVIDALISLGSFKLKAKSATSRIDGGQIFHQENVNFFNELATINEAMIEKNGERKQISFKYAQYKYKGEEIVLVKEREHIVSPYFFVSQKGNYYLVGYNHKKECLWHYRMDYVKDVKILKDTAYDKDKTELKDKSIGKYVVEHPYMFAGEAKGIEVKVPAERFGIVKDTFGESYISTPIDNDYVKATIYCTEDDAFHWAMQYGSYIEVLKPQSLRNRIRYHVENMTFNYFREDGDRYTEAIRLARSRKILNLEGIDLTGKTKHFNLKNVRTILLSNNKIDNVDFIKNMPYLKHVCIKNNPITDLSALKECKSIMRLELENLKIKDIEPIADLPIETLSLGLGKTEDLSAVYKLKKLKWLKASEVCADYNTSLSSKWDELEKRGVHTWIFERESDNVNTNAGAHLNAQYPYNLLNSIFGRDNVWVGDHNEISLAVDKFIEKFTDKEKAYLDLIYKQRVSNRDARKTLTLSDSETRTLHNDLLKKFRNPIFTDSLEKFIEEEDRDKNYSYKETLVRLKKS